MHFGSERPKKGSVVCFVSVEFMPPSLVSHNGDVSAPGFDKEEAGVSIFISWVACWDNMDMWVGQAEGLVVEVGDG